VKTSEQIRDEFIRYFEERGHTAVPSASLVPHGDPTLLFTNAGMNQFKDVFLGTGSRPYTRAVDTQKCLRVSGKHNDLEEVGHDTYHHTFFEMLGNWSFGDYFKEDAIRWAWDLLVNQWGLEPDRLYATVHEGDARLGLEPDDEAADLWKSVTGIKPEHVKFCGSKDNFWMMGETGPCGPCSEIHVDLRTAEERAATPGIDLVNADDPRVMEIWNLVFIQYNAQANGVLEPLKAQHVDTGMGFERIVAVLQQKTSNYDTDLFEPILAKLATLSPRSDVRGYEDIAVEDEAERERIRIAMRVVADHVRTIALAVGDGVTPGNVGRNYVIRRILRRAVRYGYQTLGFREPFLFRLVEPLREKMGGVFKELAEQQDYIERVIRAEEESFLETLGTGIAFFERITPYLERLAMSEEHDAAGSSPEQVLDELEADRQTIDLLQKAYIGADRGTIRDRFSRSASQRQVPGEIAFLLHDTYGFPIDLTGLMAREEGLGVDMGGYDALMKQQKERARSASAFGGGDVADDTSFRPVSNGEDSVFVGYDTVAVTDTVIRGVRALAGENGEGKAQLILEQTPFYAEAGGQTADTGILRVGDEQLRVLDVQKHQGRIVHTVDRLPKDLDAPVEARVDAGRRLRIMKHHTATHLLHAELRATLGRHVQQKGSLVAPDRLRFDFSHFERVPAEVLHEIEVRVNERIQRNIRKEEDRSVPVDEAMARGAMALFGEKYGERVRVITFDPEYSVELCGGTHVEATGEIGLFRFMGESSVAAGVRRIEAVVGEEALAFVHGELAELNRVRGLFRSLGRPVDEEVADLTAEVKRLERELESARRGQLASNLDEIITGAVSVGPARIAVGEIPATDMDSLRELAQTLLDRLGESSVALLGTVDPDGEKVYLAAAVSDDLIAGTSLKAGAIVGALAKRVGGGGGGRPQLATAGGRQPENLKATLDAATALIGEMLA
jgi:alanyl-tRNA synthetase